MEHTLRSPNVNKLDNFIRNCVEVCVRHYGNVRRKQLTAWSDLNLQERGKQSGMGSFSPFLPAPPPPPRPSLSSSKFTKSLLESHCFWVRSFINFYFWCFQTYRPQRRVHHQWFTTWFWYQLAWCYLLCVDGYFVGPSSISSEAIQSSISFSLATREYSSFTILLVSLKKLLGHARRWYKREGNEILQCKSEV